MQGPSRRVGDSLAGQKLAVTTRTEECWELNAPGGSRRSGWRTGAAEEADSRDEKMESVFSRSCGMSVSL